MKARHLTASGLLMLVTGCGGNVLSTASYASATDDHGTWKHLLPGQRIVLHAPAGSVCPAMSGASFSELESGGVPLAGHPSAARAQVLEIVDSRVKTGPDGFVGLEVRAKSGQSSWIKLPAGSRAECVRKAPDNVDEVAALVGKRLGFAPWRPECKQVVAVGDAPAAMLVDADPGVPLEVDSFAMGAPRAADRMQGKPGDALWVVMTGGALEVRADSAKACFAPGGQQPTGVTELLRQPMGRCTQNDDGGKTHLECRSTLGVWSGTTTDRSVELRAVRRTLGAVHFLDGTPVSGARYAKAVVSVTQGAAGDPRGRALNQALDRSVRRAIENDPSGNVRISSPGAADVTYLLHVEVSDLRIGELERIETTGESQYKIRDEIRDNPDKPAAEQRVVQARSTLAEAEREYREERRTWEQAKQAAIDECRRQAEQVKNDSNRAWANAGCDVASVLGHLVEPSDSDVRSAQSEVTEAESELAGMPDTITVPIMGTWTYPKIVYRRATGATLKLAMRSAGESEPTVVSMKLDHRWEDYEVQADGAHNVKGHEPDRRPIQSDDALVPFVAEKASQMLAVRLRAALSQAAIEQARQAFLAAGNSPSKPGFEAVDAIAFETAGGRIERAVLRGEATLAEGAPFALPVRSAKPAPGACMLAVAVADGASATDLALASKDGTVADLRGGSLAVIEACDGEPLGELSLSSKLGGTARWGLYLTRSEQKP